ncbi:hypothetical protein NDU88_000474 [Pleurodeles waltl]|uniref:Uncharacterized protein n=1 Tax=Pleurodeles waltl TaxID=8319 RepID=A0AAV7N805_PLEWA|nr:hypothetical protein NDU88_000474 [Pleurodeles waltl]
MLCAERGEARHPTLGLRPRRGQQREPQPKKRPAANPAAGKTDTAPTAAGTEDAAGAHDMTMKSNEENMTVLECYLILKKSPKGYQTVIKKRIMQKETHNVIHDQTYSTRTSSAIRQLQEAEDIHEARPKTSK